MTEIEDTIFDTSDFQGIKIEKEETVFDKLTFGNEIKEVESEEEEYCPEEEANRDGNFPCLFRKELDKLEMMKKTIKDSNSMTELEETKFDASDFPNIKFKKEETIFEKLTFENEIKEEMEFEEVDIWPEGKANCDGNFPCSFREEFTMSEKRKRPSCLDESQISALVFASSGSEAESDPEAFSDDGSDTDDGEPPAIASTPTTCNFTWSKKFSIRKDAVFAEISSSESHDATKEEITHKKDKQTGGESSVNEIYFSSEKCASDGDESIQAFCSEYDYVSNDRRESPAHLKSFPCNTVGNHVSSIHVNEKPFKCTECDHTFILKEHLASHINSVHIKIKLDQCLVCAICSNGTLTIPRKEKPFKCTECYYSCNRKAILIDHIRSVHRKEKTFKCTECDYSCSRNGTLKFHIRSVHRKEKPLKCGECNYSCSQKSRLTVHISSVHNKEKPFSCTECVHSCSQNGDLTRHIQSVHRKEKPFKCTECDYYCSRNGTLRFHIRSVHYNEKPFKCTECDYFGSRKRDVTIHFRTVHRKEKPFKCSECKYSSSLKGSLKRHFRFVHKKIKTLKVQ